MANSVAKNSVFLTIRMLIVMMIQFFTSRVVLDKLGVQDFGVYNVVSSVAISFYFFSSSLTNATQRFITIEIGQSNIKKATKIFNQHLEVYVLTGVFCVLAAECLGIGIIDTKLSIPFERIEAAKIVFHFAMATLLFGLASIPFESCVLAHEDMDVYAYISIVDAALKLVIIYLLNVVDCDKLVLYSFLLFMTTLLNKGYFIIHSFCKYSECSLMWYWNKTILKKSLSFIGWNVVGTLRATIITQGMDIMLNVFLGPIVNAARGVTNQISGAIFKFSSNITMAAQPQMIKLYAQNDIELLNQLFFKTSKFTYFVLLILICPFLFCKDYILHIWLKEVPMWTSNFVCWQLISSLIYVLTKPVWSIIIAVGCLKRYVIWDTITSLMPFPVSWGLLMLDYSPVYVYASMTILQIVNTLVLVIVVHRYINFSISEYCKDVLAKLLWATLLSFLFVYCIQWIFTDSILSIITNYALSAILTMIIIYFTGLKVVEKQSVLLKSRNFINKVIK